MSERNWNATIALLISLVLWGALSIQYFEKETPCIYCLLQRIGMLGVAFGTLLNVKFGISRSHYALSLFSALFGSGIALRQIGLHVCPASTPFGKPFWGLSLYVWSFIVFSLAILSIALLMFCFQERKEHAKDEGMLGKISFLSIFFVSFINIITTFYQCGWGDCE